MIIATAGHIDHGKTSLVRALTGFDTDRLPEEKVRGISIDVGFAHLSLSNGKSVDLIDVPGHEKFIKHMLTGVHACELLLLVVAADDGLMAQTFEHLNICSLLEIKQVCVILTKIDKVDEIRISELKLLLKHQLIQYQFESIDFFCVNNLTGEGVDSLKRHLIRVCEDQKTSQVFDESLSRFVIDRIFSVPGAGTVLTGTLISGCLSPGQTLRLMPSQKEYKVKGLQRHNKSVHDVRAGERCAINLAHLEVSNVSRGDHLVDPLLNVVTQNLLVKLNSLKSNQITLKHWMPIHFHHCAKDVLGRIILKRGAAIEPGKGHWVNIKLDEPVQANHGDLFVIRDPSAQATIGGGVVLDPVISGKEKNYQLELDQTALSLSDEREVINQLLKIKEPLLNLNWIQQITGFSQQKINSLLPSNIIFFNDLEHQQFVVLESKLQDHLISLRLNLKTYHEQHPSEFGMDVSQWIGGLKGGWPSGIKNQIVRRWVSQGEIKLQGRRVSLNSHRQIENPLDAKLRVDVYSILRKNGFKIPKVQELSVQLNRSPHLIRDFLHRAADNGELIKINVDRFCLPQTIDELAQHAKTLALLHDSFRFSASQYKDQVGVGRSLAIEILECLDRLRLTMRVGNERRFIGD